MICAKINLGESSTLTAGSLLSINEMFSLWINKGEGFENTCLNKRKGVESINNLSNFLMCFLYFLYRSDSLISLNYRPV